MMIIEEKSFPPKTLNENGVEADVIYSDSSEDMNIRYIYTENYGYAFKKNKDNKNFEELREKRKLTNDEKVIVKVKGKKQKENNERERIFKKYLPAIEAFESSMQCGNRDKDQGRNI